MRQLFLSLCSISTACTQNNKSSGHILEGVLGSGLHNTVLYNMQLPMTGGKKGGEIHNIPD